MVKKSTRSSSRKSSKPGTTFYKVTITPEKESSDFYPEYSILVKTVDAVNSFRSIYKVGRAGKKGGPSTHAQQDLYRAMLTFACAGLDVLVKQLIRTKLPKLMQSDSKVKEKFKEFLKRGIKRDEKEILNVLALALVDDNPKEILSREYIETLTGESLQSIEELRRVSDAAGLPTEDIFTKDKMNALKDAFIVRNQIIHEMDLNVSPQGTKKTGYRTRRQRKSPQMEQHTLNILDLAQELFLAVRSKF